MSELRELQEWMLDYVTAPEPGPIEGQVTRPERMQIYRGMFPIRMVESMAMDYPGVQHYLGEEAFERTVMEYVQVYPSRSWTLNRLGDHFWKFLQSGFLSDLARLELAICEVFDAPESPVLTPQQVAEIEDWSEARLRFVEAFRLLELDYPAHLALKAVLEGIPEPARRKKKSWVAVWRHQYALWRIPLSREQHKLLKLLQEGVPLEKALARLRSVEPQQIFGWFSEWVTEGFFQSVDRAASAAGAAGSR